jgi:hypothetical protein
MSEPTPPSAGDAPGAARASLGVYFALVLAVGIFMTGAGYLWRGLDFAGATLLGFCVVALNFVWTKNLIHSILFVSKKRRAWVVLSFLFKFALTAIVLYYAIVRFRVDPVGILFGLSTMLVASLLFAFYVQRKAG